MSSTEELQASNTLKRKATRWQATADADGEGYDEAVGRYSLLLFLRDLDDTPDKWAEFVNGLRNAPSAIDEKSTMATLLAAANDTRPIDYDYLENPDINAKRRRLILYGNQDAEDQVGEHDALVTIARRMWPDPDDLEDVLGNAYEDNIRKIAEGGERELYNPHVIFSYARSWSEVRYRFMNHALRDDPAYNDKYSTGRGFNKGTEANTIVHKSNVLLDAVMCEFQLLRGTGYNDQDRYIFQELYQLSPEEGRELLRFTGDNNGLRIGLSPVFNYFISFINSYMTWRVRVLESARKLFLQNAAFRSATSNAQRNRLRAEANEATAKQIRAADLGYRAFVNHVRVLLDEANTLDAFNKTTFDQLEKIIATTTGEVRNCQLNKAPDLKDNRKFQTELRNFPSIMVPLRRPTGTSMIAPPRQRGSDSTAGTDGNSVMGNA
ncbi:hypothetical protein F4808DRAFT_469040 [Astrocystis sublimbata]|nr:hypothetical protein F4808DRAFT_469040 [Astrocystis sublimbata]